jgi:hypothetical protein
MTKRHRIEFYEELRSVAIEKLDEQGVSAETKNEVIEAMDDTAYDYRNS